MTARLTKASGLLPFALAFCLWLGPSSALAQAVANIQNAGGEPGEVKQSQSQVDEAINTGFQARTTGPEDSSLTSGVQSGNARITTQDST